MGRVPGKEVETVKMMVLRRFEKDPGRSMDMIERVLGPTQTSLSWSGLEEKLLIAPGQPSATVMVGLPELSQRISGATSSLVTGPTKTFLPRLP